MTARERRERDQRQRPGPPGRRRRRACAAPRTVGTVSAGRPGRSGRRRARPAWRSRGRWWRTRPAAGARRRSGGRWRAGVTVDRGPAVLGAFRRDRILTGATRPLRQDRRLRAAGHVVELGEQRHLAGLAAAVHPHADRGTAGDLERGGERRGVEAGALPGHVHGDAEVGRAAQQAAEAGHARRSTAGEPPGGLSQCCSGPVSGRWSAPVPRGRGSAAALGVQQDRAGGCRGRGRRRG